MSKRQFWAGLLGAVVSLASGAKDADAAKTPRQPVYVDEVQAPASVKAGEAFEVTVSGNLPTPSWAIDEVELKKAGHTVTITLWGRLKDHRLGIQMLAPFSRKVPVTGLTAGAWTIEVVGHNGSGDSVKVQVH